MKLYFFRMTLCSFFILLGTSCKKEVNFKIQSESINGENSRPNIILIMSDDMGYSDIGSYGGVINTPVLDGLADNGLRFMQFYNTGRCCPTRASLLTGLYQHQAGVGHMMNDRGSEAYQGDLSKNAVTIAEVLKEAGYATYMSGK
jgi:arylsulfatase A-like enzyme